MTGHHQDDQIETILMHLKKAFITSNYQSKKLLN